MGICVEVQRAHNAYAYGHVVLNDFFSLSTL